MRIFVISDRACEQKSQKCRFGLLIEAGVSRASGISASRGTGVHVLGDVFFTALLKTPMSNVYRHGTGNILLALEKSTLAYT